MLCLAAIGWRKKTFRKQFHQEENFFEFHRCAHRLLDAPTMKVAKMIQSEIVKWLHEIGESRAGVWFEENWTGDKGNYTLASAGFVGSNDAQHIESHWRYMKEETVGGAGTNMQMPLRVFVPSLKTFVRNASQKHAGTITGSNGELMFPSSPKITSALWKTVQAIDIRRLDLAYMEMSAAARESWKGVMHAMSAEGEVNTSVTEKIRVWHEKGGRMEMARTKCVGILMPTDELITSLVRQGYKDLPAMQHIVGPMIEQFQILYHLPDEFPEKNPDMSPSDILELMVSFVRYPPRTYT